MQRPQTIKMLLLLLMLFLMLLQVLLLMLPLLLLLMLLQLLLLLLLLIQTRETGKKLEAYRQLMQQSHPHWTRQSTRVVRPSSTSDQGQGSRSTLTRSPTQSTPA